MWTRDTITSCSPTLLDGIGSSYHTERLTNHYYGETGFDKGRRQRANWNKRELADEAGAFEGTVLKTSDEAKITEYTALSRVFVQS